MAAYTYHHWQDDDGREGLIDFEQYYTFPSPSKNHAGGAGIFNRLLKRQYRQVDDSCQYAKKKQQLASQSLKSLSKSQSKSRQWGADLRSDQPCPVQGSPTTPAAMRAFSSSTSSSTNLKARHRQCNPDQSPRPSAVGSALSAPPIAATTADQQPNIFSRLLRRAQSKKALKPAKPNTAEKQDAAPPLPAAKEPGDDVAAQGEDNQRTAAMERKSTLRLKKSIRSRFRGPEQPPRQPEATEPRKPSAVYVPRHAAADFTRTAVPNPDAAARFASFDDARRRPSSSSQAPVSPTLHRPRTSPGHHNNPNNDGEDYFQQPQLLLQPQQAQQSNQAKRRSWALSNTESRPNRFSFASYNAEADFTTAEATSKAAASATVDDHEMLLQPNSADQAEQRPRQSSKRHSYRLVPDPHDSVIEEETDFQRFLNQAAEEDRRYRQDLWRTLSQRSRAAGGAGILPPPVVSRDAGELDLQVLLGGADWTTTAKPQRDPSRERSSNGNSNKRASDSHRKRASLISYRSQTDRTKQQQLMQQDAENAPPLPSAEVKANRRHSVTKRVQEYFKPEGVVNLHD
ncbi:hypothetical protein PG993_002897 [Apiospora rasikravindrae]|uniref:Uncharacterized protein n=1 Tax=Apiospora rasikravindrae TaxID=990691 RepID=A0ABR1TY18_9PEZI